MCGSEMLDFITVYSLASETRLQYSAVVLRSFRNVYSTGRNAESAVVWFISQLFHICALCLSISP